MSSMQKNPHCPECSHPFGTKDPARPHGPRIPYLLHCGHTFCECCLSKQTRNGRKSILCPGCNTVTDLGESGSLNALWPDAYVLGLLSTNRKIAHDQQRFSGPGVLNPPSPALVSQNKPKEVEELCDECSANTATCKCNKCEVLMCGDCFNRVHASSKSLRMHQALSIRPDVQLEMPKKCVHHGGRPIEYFCDDDNTPICSHCVIVGGHKEHAITSLEERNKKSYLALVPAIQKAMITLKKLKKSDRALANIVPQVRHELSHVCDEIRKNFLSLHQMLQAREVMLLSKVEKVFLDEVVPVMGSREDIKVLIKNIETAVSEGHKMMQSGDSSNSALILQKLRIADDTECFVQLVDDITKPLTVFDLNDMGIRQLISTVGDVVHQSKNRVKFVKLAEAEGDSLSENPMASLLLTPTDTSSRIVSDGENEDCEVRSVSSGTGSVKSRSTTSRKIKAGDQKKEIKKLTIGPKKQELVYVTHIKNPCHFVIQKCSEFERLKALGRQINKHCMHSGARGEGKLLASYLERDQLVLAQYSRDGSWYRARVLDMHCNAEGEPDFGVYYLDYGNSEIVNISKLRNIPTKFLRLPEQAYVCSLKDVVSTEPSGEWSPGSVQAFAKMTEDKPMILTILAAQNDSSVLTVDLSKPPTDLIQDDRPVSIRDALIFLEFAAFNAAPPEGQPTEGVLPRSLQVKREYLSPEPPKLGAVLSVLMSHVVSPDTFYVQQIAEEARYLSVLMSDLQEVYDKDRKEMYSICCPQEGMICAARFSEDNQWYRAVISRLPGSRMVEVHYVDFGNSEILPYTRLKKLLDRFLLLPSQAVACRVAGVAPVDSELGWTQQAVSMLAVYAHQAMSVRVAEDTDDDDAKLPLVLFTGENVCVNRLMVEAGVAVDDGSNTQYTPIPTGSLFQPDCGSVPTIQQQPELAAAAAVSSTSSSLFSTCDGSSQPSRPSALATGSKKPPAGAEKMVVTHVVSPAEIYLVPADSVGKLAELAQTLKAVYESTEALPGASWQPGDACVARRHDDGAWCRGRVVNAVDESHVTVFLVDCGASVALSCESLRPPLAAGDSDLPAALCRRCHLVGIQPAGDLYRWSRTAIEFLTDQLMKDGVVGTTVFVEKKPCDDGGESGDSQAAELHVETIVPGDALTEDMVTFTPLSQLLKDHGLALPRRRTATHTAESTSEEAAQSLLKLEKLINSDQSKTDDRMSDQSAESVSKETNDCEQPVEGQKEKSSGKISVAERIAGTTKFCPPVIANDTCMSPTSIVKEVLDEAIDRTTRDADANIETNRPQSPPPASSPPSTHTPPPSKPAAAPIKRYRAAPKPAVGTSLDVVATYVDYSGTIYVQEVKGGAEEGSNEEEEGSMVQHIMEFMFMKCSVSAPCGADHRWVAGEACVAQYSLDNLYYRAEVIEVDDVVGIRVRYVDFGNNEVVSRVRLWPPVLVDIPHQCFPCTVHGVKPNTRSGKWAVGDLDRLHALVVGQPGRVVVRGAGDGDKKEEAAAPVQVEYCLLGPAAGESADNVVEVAQFLLTETAAIPSHMPVTEEEEEKEDEKSAIPRIAAAIPLKPSIPIPKRKVASAYDNFALVEDDKMLVTVTEVESPSVVFVQRAPLSEAGADEALQRINSDLDALIAVSEYMHSHSRLFPVADHGSSKPGDRVCARFSEDSNWYRGEILDVVNEQFAAVLFVDYGTCEFVHKSLIRVFPAEEEAEGRPPVLSLPAQARRCVLAGLEEAEFSAETEEEAKASLTGIVSQGALVAVVTDYSDQGDPIITLHSCDSYESQGSDAPIIYAELVAHQLLDKETVNQSDNQVSDEQKTQTENTM